MSLATAAAIWAVAVMLAISAIWRLALAMALHSPPVAAAYGNARRGVDAVAGAVFVAFGAALATSSR